MRKVLRRTGWTLMAAGALGMINPCLAQMPMNMVQVPAVRVGHPIRAGAPATDLRAGSVSDGLTKPSVSDGVNFEDMIALEEMKLELAWLANPSTFPYQLRAQVKRTAQGTFVEIQGYILNEAVREQALKTARTTTKLLLADSMRVYPGLTLRSGSAKPENLRASAVQVLTDAFGEQASRFEVTTTPTGQVVISGVIASFEEKLSVSRLLKRLPGCYCVDNRLNVNIVLREGKPHVVVSVDGRRAVPLATPSSGQWAVSSSRARAPATDSAAEPDRQVRTSVPGLPQNGVTLVAPAPGRVVALGEGLPTSPPTVALPSQYPGAPMRPAAAPVAKTPERVAVRQPMPAYQMIASTPQPAKTQTQLSTVVRGPVPGAAQGQPAAPVTVSALNSEYMPVTPPRPGSRVVATTAHVRAGAPATDPAPSPAPVPQAAPIVPVDFRAVVQNRALMAKNLQPAVAVPAVSTVAVQSPVSCRNAPCPAVNTSVPGVTLAQGSTALPPAITTTVANVETPMVLPVPRSSCEAGACQVAGVSGKSGPVCFPPIIDTASAVKPTAVQPASATVATKPKTAAPRLLPGTMVSAPMILPTNQKHPAGAVKPMPKSGTETAANSEVHVLQASYKTNAAPENTQGQKPQPAKGAGTTWSWKSLFGSKGSPSPSGTSNGQPRPSGTVADGKPATVGLPAREPGLWTIPPQATLQAPPMGTATQQPLPLTSVPTIPASPGSTDNQTLKVSPTGTEKLESAATQAQPYSMGTMSFSLAPSDPTKAIPVPAATIGAVAPASHVIMRGTGTQPVVTMGLDADSRARFKQRVEAACGKEVKSVEVKMQPNGQLCVVLTVPGTTDIEALSRKVFEMPEIISKQVHAEIVLMP